MKLQKQSQTIDNYESQIKKMNKSIQDLET